LQVQEKQSLQGRLRHFAGMDFAMALRTVFLVQGIVLIALRFVEMQFVTAMKIVQIVHKTVALVQFVEMKFVKLEKLLTAALLIVLRVLSKMEIFVLIMKIALFLLFLLMILIVVALKPVF